MKIWLPSSLDKAPASVRDTLCARFVRGLNESGQSAIGNLQTELAVLSTGTHCFPLSLNHGSDATSNCYVVSPLCAYTTYARDELTRLQQPWLSPPLNALITALARYLRRSQMDRLVHVNNWLVSTNVYPKDWQGQSLDAITPLLTAQWPEHAICFRSLNTLCNAPLMDALNRAGYLPVPSRQVYIFDGRQGEHSSFLARHNTRLDGGLLRQSPYHIEDGSDLDEADFARIEHLYDLLYLKKYSPLNPQYTRQWLRLGRDDGWLELRVLRNASGQIDAALGWLCNEAVITAPLVGYDTALPQKFGLYRCITHLCLQEAAKRKQILNFSSGASHFKRLRGGVPAIEYSFVYIRHLSPSRQRMWRILHRVLTGVGIPVMQRYKL